MESSSLHVVTLGNLPPPLDHSREKPRPKTAKTERDKLLSVKNRPVSAAIDRYRTAATVNAASRDKRISGADQSNMIVVDTKLQNDPGKDLINDISGSAISKVCISRHHSGAPLGAHNSGFYSKMRMDTFKVSNLTPSIQINNLLKHKLKSGSKSQKRSDLENEPPRSIFSIAKITIETTGDYTMFGSNLENLELELAQLSDIDADSPRILETLKGLIEAIQSEMQTSTWT